MYVFFILVPHHFFFENYSINHSLTPSLVLLLSPTHHPLTPSSKEQSYHSKLTNSQQFAQELLSTFSLSLGEVALQPSTGGTFIVTIHHLSPASSSSSSSSSSPPSVQSTTLWDRKTDGGFPETKELKRRVRDVIDPSRDLGHVDRNHRAAAPAASVTETAPVEETAAPVTEQPAKQEQDQNQTSSTILCEDCT
jgi:predicted Rdx family selenoprotein